MYTNHPRHVNVGACSRDSLPYLPPVPSAPEVLPRVFLGDYMAAQSSAFLAMQVTRAAPPLASSPRPLLCGHSTHAFPLPPPSPPSL